MKHLKQTLVVVSLTALALGALGSAQMDQAARPSAGAQYVTSDVHHFDPFPEIGAQVSGAKAWLIATDSGVTTIVEAAELPPGDAVTLWWVIFNEPQACAGHPEPCSLDDLMGNPGGVGAEVTWAAGTVVADDGTGKFVGHLPIGPVAGGWFGNGLTDPLGAEVHLVLRSHGPALPEVVDHMVSTFREGCHNVEEDHPAFADGLTGPNECHDLQFVILVQR